MENSFLNDPFRIEGKKIWVSGHHGMVGTALVRRLDSEVCEVLTVQKSDLDLRNQGHVQQWVNENKPDVVIMAAAKVGGILANDSEPADFLYDNLMIESNVIHVAYQAGVEKLLFLGSSCIYPKEAENPIREEALLSGKLEPTNEAYAVAKIAGIKLCQAYRKQHGCDYIAAMPCNLYGPGDRFDLERSHVIPALMMKIHAAKLEGASEIEIWGTGTPRREFLHVDDLADGLIFLLKNYSSKELINVGAGTDLSIADLVAVIMDVVGFEGQAVYNTARPDGVKAKLMDSGRIFKAGWHPQTDLKTGLVETYEWYQEYCGQRDAA